MLHTHSITFGVIVAVAVIAARSATLASATVGFDNCTRNLYELTAPTQLGGRIELCRGGVLAISYEPAMRNPHFSAWRSTTEECQAYTAGRLSFKQDPDLAALSVPQARSTSDVWSSYYNRGHLAPSRMLSFSDWGKRMTYYYSNVAPQHWRFNQQSWKHLETDLFEFVRDTPNTTLYLVTGVEYANRSSVVFNDSIAMPDFYMTAVCDPARGQSAGFIGRNVAYAGGILDVYRSVRELEERYFGTRGTIFDRAECNTLVVDPAVWGFSDYVSSTYEPVAPAAATTVTLGFPGDKWGALVGAAAHTFNRTGVRDWVLTGVRDAFAGFGEWQHADGQCWMAEVEVAAGAVGLGAGALTATVRVFANATRCPVPAGSTTMQQAAESALQGTGFAALLTGTQAATGDLSGWAGPFPPTIIGSSPIATTEFVPTTTRASPAFPTTTEFVKEFSGIRCSQNFVAGALSVVALITFGVVIAL